MAKINKLQKSGETIYPATIPQAVIDPDSGKSQKEVNEEGKNRVANLEVGIASNKLKVVSVDKRYQTRAEALADKNPINPDTSSPLTVGKYVSIVADGDKNGIFKITSIDGSGTMTLVFESDLGDMSAYMNTISEGLLSNYIGFEIDEDMNLIMSTPDNYYGPEFVLENGELKVII